MIMVIYFTIYLGQQSNGLTEGSLIADELTETVNISYDSNGIPSIDADNDVDAFFAMGFVHAQNRLWQMETHRRIASGRLSEVIGQSGLSSDVFMRTLGLNHNVERIFASLGSREKSILEAYTNGVNSGIKNLNALPLEFEFYSHTPEMWKVTDSLLKMQLLSSSLALNFSREFNNYLIASTFSEGVVAELLPEPRINNLETSVELFNFSKLLTAIPPSFAVPKSFVGSNAWAISGEFTDTGMPIVANDPHMENTLPSQFYLLKAKGGKLNVSGATFPGLPFIVSGHNENIAWGITSMMADTQDLYIERLNPHNSMQYEVNGKYRDMEVVTETVHIKNDPLKTTTPPYRFQVRRTHRGAVISDLSQSTGQTFSLRWTGDDEDGGSLNSFINMNYAKSHKEFISGMSEHVAPILNIVYGDTDNNIGMIAPGKYPIRNSNQGHLPKQGWFSESDWSGWIAPSHWPQQHNPKSGIIVAANQDVLVDGYPYYISSDWAPNYRADKITGLLRNNIDGKGVISSSVSKTIQQDLSHAFKDVMQSYLETKPNLAMGYRDLLLSWDGEMTSDSAAGALVTVWLAHTNQLLYEDDVQNTGQLSEMFTGLLNELQYEQLELAFQNGSSELCKYRTDEKAKSCEEVIALAFERAVVELKKKLGDDREDWALENLTKTQYVHFPFSGNKLTGLGGSEVNKMMTELFHREYKGKGSDISINAQGMNLLNQTRFFQVFGPSFRHVISLNEQLADADFILSTGQSGSVFSTHYDDMLEKFNDGKYVSLSAEQSERSVTIMPDNIGETYAD